MSSLLSNEKSVCTLIKSHIYLRELCLICTVAWYRLRCGCCHKLYQASLLAPMSNKHTLDTLTTKELLTSNRLASNMYQTCLRQTLLCQIRWYETYQCQTRARIIHLYQTGFHEKSLQHTSFHFYYIFTMSNTVRLLHVHKHLNEWFMSNKTEQVNIKMFNLNKVTSNTIISNTRISNI